MATMNPNHEKLGDSVLKRMYLGDGWTVSVGAEVHHDEHGYHALIQTRVLDEKDNLATGRGDQKDLGSEVPGPLVVLSLIGVEVGWAEQEKKAEFAYRKTSAEELLADLDDVQAESLVDQIKKLRSNLASLHADEGVDVVLSKLERWQSALTDLMEGGMSESAVLLSYVNGELDKYVRVRLTEGENLLDNAIGDCRECGVPFGADSRCRNPDCEHGRKP